MTLLLNNIGKLQDHPLPEPKMGFELVIKRTGHFFLHNDSLEYYPANFLSYLRGKGYTILDCKNHLMICRNSE